jgi:hypothetical protein
MIFMISLIFYFGISPMVLNDYTDENSINDLITDDQ